MSDKKTPAIVNPSTSNRITVAFPFSNIKVQEPSEQVRALALLVTELAEQLAKVDPSVETDALVQRARGITSQLS
jgi:hypothetical protein